MIVERVIEDSLDFLEQDYLMNMSYFNAGSYSPSSDMGASPSYSLSSNPGSPSSDSDGSLNASWPCRKKGVRVGRQSKGTFQGVRVKNPVRELLNQLRNRSISGVECQKLQSCEQFTELKNILGKKRPNESISDAPAAKTPCTFQCSSFLTPPSTPKSCDIMDETPKSEINSDSTLDLLQSIINIKHESKPVSLNTVQVSWMNNLPQNISSQESFYQDIAVPPSFSPAQANQAFGSCSPQQNDDQYQFGCAQVQNMSPQCPPEMNYSQVQQFPEVCCSNDELQSCAIESYLSLFDSSPEITSSNISVEPTMQPQNLSPPLNPPCNQYVDLKMVHPSPNVSPSLCQADANRTSPLQFGKSFFHWQIEQEEKKLVNVPQEHLLSKDADGDTYLHIAVAQGKRAMSYVLASKMAALNMLDVKEHNSQSALQVAVAANHHLIVQDLIGLGAQVSTTDSWGRTPLHVCATKGYSQVLQAIQKGLSGRNEYIDVDTTNYDGLTPLHCAVIAHNAIVQQLQLNQQSCTPAADELMMKNKSMVDTVKILLQMGASVEARDRKSGRTALHLACEDANLELMSLFLELPNSINFINAKAYNGNTALHVASSLQCRRAHVGAVKLLMRKGADPSSRNLENEQPVHLVSDGPVGEEIRRVLKGKTAQHRLPTY
ncbi:NF-kappa-B inhibitor zeta [Gastrophryne carolinensis]